MGGSKASSSTARVLEMLQRFESRNVTCVDPAGGWPIVWERARGMHVWDAEGRRYLDLTAAFGVAAAGHANPRVVAAGQKQMRRLLHAMGDVHPHRLKAELACTLSELTFERWTRRTGVRGAGKTIFCNSGFEAVEAALKTALLATGKSGVVAFEGGYHGLGYGALNTTHREHFWRPFQSQLSRFGRFVEFPESPEALARVEALVDQRLRAGAGCVLVEPVQARGGVRVPPRDFLPLLRRLCDRHGALLVLDEIFTGFGRTGRWFACEHSHTVPDLVCLGKAMTGGFPLSACVGSAEVMDRAWPPSTGEAIHTSTFLGHPVGCAMALAQIGEIQRNELVQRSAQIGRILLPQLSRIRAEGLECIPRGLGLLAGLELRRNGRPASAEAMEAIREMLHRGFVLLPEGEFGNVVSLTPPLTISETQLKKTVAALQEVLQRPRASRSADQSASPGLSRKER